MDNYLRTVWNLWQTMRVDLSRMNPTVIAAAMILKNISKYETVAYSIGCPPWLVGAIHYRECSSNFNRHLHNGDPLTMRTTHQPPGRPLKGLPPFQWDDSAFDALIFKGWDRVNKWDIVNCLIIAEVYNGLGYKLNGHISPYIWAQSNHYQSGLYVADHKFDASKIDQRPGVATLAFALKTMGVQFNEVAPG